MEVIAGRPVEVVEVFEGSDGPLEVARSVGRLDPVEPIEQPFTAERPLAIFAGTMAELLDAARTSGAMDQTISAPCGEVTGEVFARFVAFDGLVHGWDIAIATGLTYAPPDGLVEEVERFARRALSAEMRDGDTFARAQEAGPEADPLTRVVAFSGRPVPAGAARSVRPIGVRTASS